MDSPADRLEDLLLKRSLEGLEPDESTELEALLSSHPEVDSEAFDRAAAAVSVANLRVTEPMPERLYASIEARGIELLAKEKRAAGSAQIALPQRQSARRLPRRRQPAPQRILPWLVAAASLVVAAIAWWQPAVTPTGVEFESLRAASIERGARIAAWTATDDPASVGAFGDVVWDAARQEGYLRISMLAANNPDEFQYQLWIFDAERDERFPVDGGVFDIPPGATEAVIPVRAAIQVHSAVLFAVTIEAPGGVVVSDRERITLVADFSQA